MKFFERFFKEAAPKEISTLGFDIGSTTIKFAKLASRKDGIVLLNAGVRKFETANLALDIKNIVQAEAADVVTIGLNGSGTLIRHINFPRMSKEELQSAIKFEAQNHIPLPINEVTIDPTILREDLPDNKMLVLLAVVKNTFLSERLKFFSDAGIKVQAVDINSVALTNSFAFNYFPEESEKGRSVAILDIGAVSATINILEEGMLRLSRDIYIAGNNFTKRISDVLGISIVEAEQLKCSPPEDKLKHLSEIVQSVLTYLSMEIRMSFDYYESQCSCSISRIFIGGGGSLFPGLKEMLAEMLGIEVLYWDPFKRIKPALDQHPQEIVSSAPRLGVSVGLALGKAKEA